MLSSYTLIEILLSLAVIILTGHELNSLLGARREGLTENKSRVFTHGLIMVLAVVYMVLAWMYLPLEGKGPIQEIGTPTVPWAYLFIGGLLAVVATFEAVSMLHARATGLTTNVSRLVSYAVILLVLLSMLGLAVRKWEAYLDRLDATAVQGAQPHGSP